MEKSTKGFLEYCSYTCGNNSPKHIAVMKSQEHIAKSFGEVGYSTLSEETKIQRNDAIRNTQANRTQESKDLERQRSQETWANKTPEEMQEYHINLTQSRLKKYGCEYTWQIPAVREKIKQTSIKNWGYEHPMQSPLIKEKVKQINEERGNWITEEEVKDFKDYSALVWRHTNANDLSILKNIELRGNKPTDYHLDHMYSIFQGFKDKVPAEIIGDICNLEMLLSPRNLSKNKKCSISEDDLREVFESCVEL